MYSDTAMPMLRGRPLDVEFLGFRSDTYRLQRAGWQIAESRDPHCDEFRIAIRHPEHRMSGMSRSQTFRWRRQMMGGLPTDYDRGITLHFDLAIQYMIHRTDDVNHHPMFFPVDATPVYEEIRREDLYDMPYFRPIDEGKEIFLRKASVDEIMQIALDKQEPEQARIRAARQAEQKREDYKRGGTTKAKLIMVS